MNMSDVRGKKVKIFVSMDETELEEQINEFLSQSNRPVWNIQYQCAGTKTPGVSRYSALIIYG